LTDPAADFPGWKFLSNRGKMNKLNDLRKMSPDKKKERTEKLLELVSNGL